MSDILGTISRLTYFPNGIAQGIIPIVGGVAGNHTVTGILTTDTLLGVQAIAFDAAGDCVSVTGLLSEFTITAANTINNTGGTNTTGSLVLVHLAAGTPR